MLWLHFTRAWHSCWSKRVCLLPVGSAMRYYLYVMGGNINFFPINHYFKTKIIIHICLQAFNDSSPCCTNFQSFFAFSQILNISIGVCGISAELHFIIFSLKKEMTCLLQVEPATYHPTEVVKLQYQWVILFSNWR